MGATSQSRAKFEDYDAFVEKFKPKKTTDDCYTPPEIYDVVADYVTERFGVRRADMVRPFYPGGDFEAFDYPDGAQGGKGIFGGGLLLSERAAAERAAAERAAAHKWRLSERERAMTAALG